MSKNSGNAQGLGGVNKATPLGTGPSQVTQL